MQPLPAFVEDIREDVKTRQWRNLRRTASMLYVWILSGTTLVALYAWGVAVRAPIGNGLNTFLETLAQSALMAAAATAVGALFGFLFGVPKTPSMANGDANGNGLSPSQQVNTSLEQISDWLTKILVGVGLTQLATIPGRLWALGQNFAVAGSTPIALTIILNHAVVGFFAGYLMTRLFLAGAFREADTVEAMNWTTKVQRAEVLAETDNHPEALGAFQELVRELPASASKEEKRRAYEGVVFNALYQDPPDGFQEAIDQAEKYIKEEPDNPSARLYAYLAAAYGQRYQYEADHDKRPKVLDESRNRTVAATRQALTIDPNIKELLRMMWDPNHPAKSPGDNDLEPFFNDPDMKKLLG